MKTLTANFTTEKNKLTGAEPRNLLEIDADSGTLYYSDQVLTVSGQGYVATVLDWGSLKGQVVPGEEVVRISNMPVTLSNNPRIDASIRPGLEVRFYLWFDGLATADKLLLFKGVISDDIEWDIYTISFNCLDVGHYFDKQIGQPLSSTSYPEADPDDVGKIMPVVYGDVEYSPCLAVEAGAISTLKTDLLAGADTMELSDASRFPAAGGENLLIMIGDEFGISYADKSGNDLIGVEGIGNDYKKGSTIMQDKSLVYLATGHAVKALANPRLIPTGLTRKEAVTVSSGVTLNTDDSDTSTITIESSEFAAIRKAVGLEVNPPGHYHNTSSAVISAWEEVAPQLGSQQQLRSLVVYKNKLYGGTGTDGRLFEWNDSNGWVEKAPRLGGSPSYILALAVYNGKLYGGQSTSGKLYEWNDVDAWVEVAPQLSAQSKIQTLAVYNSKLYGGTFADGYLYEWNDVNAWVAKTSSLGSYKAIYALVEYNSKLYGSSGSGAGGWGYLYEWNDVNAWVQVAPQLGAETVIYSLIVYNSKLYGGTAPNGKLYEWNDVDAWVEVAPQLGAETYIYSLIVYNSKLYGGTAPNGKLYEWNDVDAWVEVAAQFNDQVTIYSLAVYNGKLYGGTYSGGRLFHLLGPEDGYGDLQTIAYYNDTYENDSGLTDGDNVVDGNISNFGTYNISGSYTSYIKASLAIVEDKGGGGILRVRAKAKFINPTGAHSDPRINLYAYWKGSRVGRYEEADTATGTRIFETEWYAPTAPSWVDFVDTDTYIKLTGRADSGFSHQIDVYEIWWEVEYYGTGSNPDGTYYLPYYNDTYENDSGLTDGDNVVDGNITNFGTFGIISSDRYIKASLAIVDSQSSNILRVRAKVKFVNSSSDPRMTLELYWKGSNVASYEEADTATGTRIFETAWYTPTSPAWTDFQHAGTYINFIGDDNRGSTQLVYEMWWEIETDGTSGGITGIAYLSLTGNSVADTLGGNLVVDVEGYQDDDAGHYTGVADALIEEPWDVIHHLIENHSNGAVHADIDIAGSFADAADELPDFYTFGFSITQKVNLNRLLALLAQQTWCRFIWEAGLGKLNRIKFIGTSVKTLDTDDDSLLEDKRLMVKLSSSGLDNISNKVEVKYNLDRTLGDWSSPDAYIGSRLTSNSSSIATYGTRQRTLLFFAIGDNDVMAADIQNKQLVFYTNILSKITFPTFLKHVELERGDILKMTCTQLGITTKDYEVVEVNFLPGVGIEKQNPAMELGLLEVLNEPGYGGGGWGSQPWGA